MSWVKGKLPRIMRLTKVSTEAKKQEAPGTRTEIRAGLSTSAALAVSVSTYFNTHWRPILHRANWTLTTQTVSSHRRFTAPVHVTDLATCRGSSISLLTQPPSHSGEEGGHPVQQVTHHAQWIRTLLSRQPRGLLNKHVIWSFCTSPSTGLKPIFKKKKRHPSTSIDDQLCKIAQILVLKNGENNSNKIIFNVMNCLFKIIILPPVFFLLDLYCTGLYYFSLTRKLVEPVLLRVSVTW